MKNTKLNKTIEFSSIARFEDSIQYFRTQELAQQKIKVMLNDSQLNTTGVRLILHPQTRIQCQIYQ